MVLGFNHNVIYKGEVFHVQTEDSGIKTPHIISVLYRGGVILCSKKTTYADILMMENLESVVEELMKAQHKDMLRRLKSGEFDARAFSITAPLLENYEIPKLEPEAETVQKPAAQPGRTDDIFSSPAAGRGPAKSDISLLFELPDKDAAPAAHTALTPDQKPVKDVVSLDEAILNFFGAGKK